MKSYKADNNEHLFFLSRKNKTELKRVTFSDSFGKDVIESTVFEYFEKKRILFSYSENVLKLSQFNLISISNTA